MTDTQPERIDASPTKAFFIDMLTRDIGLEQAILDLIDNSVDGAKRIAGGTETYEGRSIRLQINGERFRMVDNCGGFDRKTAREYAFRFGRPRGATATPNSIGQFGIGMKRALFKFGRHFVVRSRTPDETWAVDVAVDDWERNDDWHFEWADFGVGKAVSTPGTEIIVEALRPSVAARFATEYFRNSVMTLIKSKHRQFIAKGLSVRVNGKHITALEITFVYGEKIRPGVDNFTLKDDGEKDVAVTIKCGLGVSSPKDAGWYVICNGRVVLEADRSETTGWGYAESAAERVIVPGFHNQFARFRGVISFDSIDSKRVPWTTTKNDVDQDSAVWARAFPRMLEMMRPVIDFLNDMAEDIDENTREASPLLQVVSRETTTKSDGLTAKSPFRAPKRGEAEFAPTTQKIQYSRTIEDIDFLKEALGVSTAKAVGEKTFDLTLRRQRG